MKVERHRVLFVDGREITSTLEVLPSDEPSAYGLRPWALFADELAQWPDSQNARGVWAACVSALPKVEGSRLVVLTSAGSPSHWAHRVLDQAKRSTQWRVSETPGPLHGFDRDPRRATVTVARQSVRPPASQSVGSGGGPFDFA